MDSVGAEVGQKMRSAIKAKLLELNCYVDDELPDYIMVMVANRRSKSQMTTDLTLFLNKKTEAFVDWLHIVLKKLKEVTVTNPEIYKKVLKRTDDNDIKIKKEKKKLKSIKKEDESLTDNLPIKLNDSNKIINKDDEFDIPLLSEVIDENLEDSNLEKHRKHSPITFKKEETIPKKVSVLERLGKRIEDNKKRKIDDIDDDKRRKRKKSPIHQPKGVMSKIFIPEKPPEEPEIEDEILLKKEVKSVVQVKPRVLPSESHQPNKNILLKALADAHRSVSQTTVVKQKKPSLTRNLSQKEKKKLQNLILSQVSSDNESDEKEFEYVPKSISKDSKNLPKYIPSTRKSIEENTSESEKLSIKSRLDARKSPSPIYFDKSHRKIENTNQKYKFFPNSKQGSKSDFVHLKSTKKCELFPNCKFGNKCLYIHPICKFGNSCTKRDCIFEHNTKSLEICKFSPNCTNVSCTFFHPKVCRFGKFCKNQFECKFSH